MQVKILKNNEFFKLTTPQKSVFLTEQYYKNTNINNISGYLHICEKVNTEKLEFAINKFIKENEQFRARFFQDENQILNQYYLSYRKEKIDVVKLKDLAEKEQYEKKYCNKKFDIIAKKLYRFCIYKLENGEGGILFAAHHLICDAWAMSLVINSIINTYSDEEEINSEKYQYKQYIYDEEEYYKSERYKQDEEYWKSVFADNVDFKNKNLQDDDISAKRIETTIKKDFLEQLLKIDNSFFNLYLSALSIYFTKINNLKNIVIGTPLLNRKNLEEKQIVGMFVNTLPLKIDVNRSITFSEFVKNNKKNEMQLFKHHKMPYEKIMKIVKENNPQVNNLFDITVSYQNARDNSQEAKVNYKTEWFFNGYISDALDVHITDLDNTGKLKIIYDYQTSKFDKGEILKIHNRIMGILQQIAENRNILLRDIKIVTKEEFDEIVGLNNIEVEIPENSSVIDVFQQQVKNTPDKVAISFEGTEITYKDLDIKSNNVANILVKNGVKKSDIVAIFMPKSLEFFINMIGILKAGATYLPLDIEFPDTRVNYILTDSKAKLCITDEESKTRISTSVNTLTNEEISKKIIDGNKPGIKIEPDDNCYIIYTSGTTGDPKGVVVTHKNVINYTYAFQTEFKLTSSKDVVLQQFTPSFDAFVEEFYPALLNGIKILSVSKQTILNFNKLGELIKENKVTLISCSPLLLNELNKINDFKTVKNYISGGDVLKKEYYSNLLENANVYNTYGPTETTVCSTYHKCNKNEQQNIPIGKTIANYKNFIVSEDNNILPKGCIGELCIGGKGLTKGYLNNPLLTASKFVILHNLNEDVFKTGDLCRFNENDEIEFVGRKDDQIKIRGYRVSLAEIEKMLCMYPLINNAIVTDFNDANNKKKHCAYYIGEDSITKKEIKEYLKKVLPAYMIPDVYIKVNEFKMTINGKIDKASLPNPNKLGTKLDTEFVPAKTDLEKKLVEIWGEILNIKQISIEDNLFELGADSLSIIDFLTLAVNENLNINAQDIYINQTIKKIAEKIDHHSMQNNNPDEMYKTMDVNELELINHRKKIENVLLTGVTGYLGIHILNEILKNSNANVYCLVRGKDYNFAKQRLRDLYRFYFNSDMKEYNKRLKVVYGDITKENLGVNSANYKKLIENIDTVIHCAATVKHYADSDFFYKTNVLGTKHVIDFCKMSNSKLHYISTVSVSGQYSERPETVVFNEKSFWIDQNYSYNEYIKSKLESEYTILNEIKNNNLFAKIYRVGNLTGRYSDGVCQKNVETNAFYRKIMTMIQLKIAPADAKDMIVDFTPIDTISNAIFKLVFKSKDKEIIYHLYNSNTITIKELVTMLNEIGFNMKMMSKEEIDTLSKQEQKQVNKLMLEIYPTINKGNIIIENATTDELLKQVKFDWPTIDKQYLLKTISYVREVMSLNYEDNQ